MSARAPFMPLGQANSSSTSSNVPSFSPNKSNPLHPSAGQLISTDPDAPLGMENAVLPLPGPMGQKAQRTSSHSSTSVPKNIFQLAGASLGRSQTTAPGNPQYSGSKQMNKSRNSGHTDRIVTPKPVRVYTERPPILTSPDLVFKAPALPTHVNLSRGMSPDESLDSLDLPNAHIPSVLHHKRRHGGVPVRQQPSPETSGTSDEMQVDRSGSFRTSTPHGRGDRQVQEDGNGTKPSFTGPQRVLLQSYPADNVYDHFYAQQQPASANRKHSRDRYATEDDSDQPAKRQRNSKTSGRSMHTPASTAGDLSGHHSLPQSTVPQTDVWQELTGLDGDRMLRSQAEHFHNRISIWQAASKEEWSAGGKELIDRLGKMLKKTEDFIDRKEALFRTLESRITMHQGLLKDREKALIVAKENLVSDSQKALGGRDS